MGGGGHSGKKDDFRHIFIIFKTFLLNFAITALIYMQACLRQNLGFFLLNNSSQKMCQVQSKYFYGFLTDKDLFKINIQDFAPNICKFKRYLQF